MLLERNHIDGNKVIRQIITAVQSQYFLDARLFVAIPQYTRIDAATELKAAGATSYQEKLQPPTRLPHKNINIGMSKGLGSIIRRVCK
jgi:hypothetical protein